MRSSSKIVGDGSWVLMSSQTEFDLFCPSLRVVAVSQRGLWFAWRRILGSAPVRREEVPPFGTVRASFVFYATAAVDSLPDGVGVTSVPSGLLDHVHRNPPQVPSHLSPCARRFKVPRISCEAAFCSRYYVMTVSMVSSVIRNPFSSFGCTSGHSPAKMRPGDDDLKPAALPDCRMSDQAQ